MSSGGHPLYIVDAFAKTAGEGNPAAVCLLPPSVSTDWTSEELSSFCQHVAFEMNLSETVFVWPVATGGTDSSANGKEKNEFHIRWFSPKQEVILCGHATLAASSVLFQQPSDSLWAVNPTRPLVFQNKLSGSLSVEKKGDLFALNFPRRKPAPVDLTPALISVLVDGLGISTELAIEEVLLHRESRKYLLVLRHEFLCPRTGKTVSGLQELADLTPKLKRLMKEFKPAVAPLSVTVTTKGRSHERIFFRSRFAPQATQTHEMKLVKPTVRHFTDYDAVSRHFAPWVGIDEDPVTGAAHVVLAPYWADKLALDSVNCFQASPRGGEMLVQLRDVEQTRVLLCGAAVVVVAGQLSFPKPQSSKL